MVRAIHQLVPNLAAGDAIGGHVRQVQAALRSAGFASEVFYDVAQPAVRSLGRPYTSFDRDRDGRDALVLFHLSTGSPLTDWLLESGLPFGVYFHNITPPEFFERWAPGAADSVRRALADMRRLAGSSLFAMANSTFSRGELDQAGYVNTSVVPILVDYRAYEARHNERLAARLRRDSDGGHRWLFLGRLAPNKCQYDVVAAFAVYRQLYDPKARLTLVGGRTADVYFRSIELLIEELGLDGAADLTDHLSDADALACFRAADVFVCLSEHEGFKVPILEAMHFGVPVVAYAAAAVPETVADGGVVLDDKDPVVVAAAVNRVLTDGALRAELVAAGRRRLDHFSLANNRERLLAALRPFVTDGAGTGAQAGAAHG